MARIIALFLIVPSLSCCTSMVEIPTNSIDSTSGAVEIGDTVQVKKTDGSSVTFEVSAIESDVLVGDGNRIENSDIYELRVRRSDGVKTALLAIGVTVGVLELILVDDLNDLKEDLE